MKLAISELEQELTALACRCDEQERLIAVRNRELNACRNDVLCGDSLLGRMAQLCGVRSVWQISRVVHEELARLHDREMGQVCAKSGRLMRRVSELEEKIRKMTGEEKGEEGQVHDTGRPGGESESESH
jgi:hypothetical protein